MKLDWHQGILYVTILGMEGCMLYALITLLNEQVADARLFILGLLLLYPAAFGFNKIIQRLRWHKGWLYTISWLVWAGAMLLMVKVQLFNDSGFSDPAWLHAVPQAMAQLPYTFEPALLILVSSILLWWLGLRLAYLKVNFAISVSEFQFGLVILLIILFVASQLNATLADSVPTMIAFFVFALLGMSITHAQEGTSWLSGLGQGHWSGLLALSISLIIIVGLLISSVVTPDFLQLFLNVLKWIWEGILKIIAFLASLFPQSEPGEPPPAMPAMPETEPSQGFQMWTIPEPLRSNLRLGWMIMIMSIIFLALWRTLSQVFSWLRHRLAGMAGAELEPLPGSFKADFLNWLKRIILKLLRVKLPSQLARKSKSLLSELTPVRQTYRQLLHWAATAGFPRSTSQTPHEYLSMLADLLPEAEGDLDFITQQYVRARYGTSLPTEAELYQLRDSWYKVRQNRLKKKSD